MGGQHLLTPKFEVWTSGASCAKSHLNSHRTAIIYTDGTTSEHLSFAEAWQRGIRMANALLELGLHPGDRIACSKTTQSVHKTSSPVQQPAGLCGCLYARNSVDGHHHMLDHTGRRAVVVAGHYLDEIDAVRDRLPNLEHVIVRGDDYESWLAGFSADDPNVEISPDDWYIIRHTGGTTGKSKVLPIATGRGLLLDATGLQLSADGGWRQVLACGAYFTGRAISTLRRG